MKKEDQNKKAQTANNEGYDVNHPQNLTKPSFNSTSENRDSEDKPNPENLNIEKGENELTRVNQGAVLGDIAHINDDALHGNIDNLDLKDDENDSDEDDEQLIRK